VTLISLSNVGVEFGATTLLTNVTFTVAQGDRWGIVGRNGTGKTTLFKLITGAQQPTSGAIAKSPGVRIALLDQHRDFAGATTVWEAAAGQFADLLALEQSLADQANQLGELGERCTQQMLDTYAHDLERFERDGGYTFAPRVDAVLHGLGFDPVEARTRPLEHLSGGERGRVGLARQLVSPADVLLLDEPTNHLDLDTTQWLESYLRETDKTILLISHDRAFLAAVVDHVLHVEGNSVVPYIGGYEQFVLQRTERRLAQQRAFQKQSRVIADESDYIRRNIAGQNSKQAKGRRKRLERIARLSPPLGEDGSMSLRLDVQERGGDQVIVADHATIAVESRTLIRDLSAVVKRGDRLGLIGPNGAGKSTFLKTLMGERAPVSGTVTAGNSITVAYYRQDLAQVPADKTLYDIISDLRPYWQRRFGFSGDETQRKATTLSGGERARVALAMIMLSRANLLIFDEPTNHLDVESIEALEDAIESYEGTVLLVSHDRALLRALCTRVWVLHDTRVTDFDGTFAEWEVASEERAHAARVAAAEEESLRRVHEQQKTRRQNASTENDRVEARRAKRAVEEAEALVERLEAEVAELTKALEDPDLYTTPAGTTQSIELGKTLERRKHELEDAIRRWSTAVDQGQR